MFFVWQTWTLAFSPKGLIFITAGERSVACGYENLGFQPTATHFFNTQMTQILRICADFLTFV
jgi:hypothetical protein